jgi:hypothetical protein
MPRRLPSSSLDKQTQITASDTGAVLAGTWYIGTGGAGGAGAVAGTLNGPLNGNAATASKWASKVTVNGIDLQGDITPITIGVNTTSNPSAGTYRPLFVPSNSAGNQQASTSGNLSYDPNTGTLTATVFSGSGSGLTGVVKSISFNGGAAVDGAVSINSPAQVQSDWNQTTTSAVDYIKNKPTIPSLSGYATESFVTTRGYLTSAPVTSVNGQTGAVTVSSPTAVSGLSQDTVMRASGGINWGMGAVPGYTYTISNGSVDDTSTVFTVPSTGWWTFPNVKIMFKGKRIGCSASLNPSSAYITGIFEVFTDVSGWTPIAAKWWDWNQINYVFDSGESRYIDTRAQYYSGGYGIGSEGVGAESTYFNRPYYLQSGNNIRLRSKWVSTVPTIEVAGATWNAGSTNPENYLPFYIYTAETPNYEWRAYPSPISFDGGYWYMGNWVQFSAIRVGT